MERRHMTMVRSIQRAAAETRLSTDKLRYYERIGTLPNIGRSETGHRRFTDDDMGWIKLVQCLRATGMPLEDLHRYADLGQSGDHAAAEPRRMGRPGHNGPPSRDPRHSCASAHV